LLMIFSFPCIPSYLSFSFSPNNQQQPIVEIGLRKLIEHTL
jgi:hypothetical protein